MPDFSENVPKNEVEGQTGAREGAKVAGASAIVLDKGASLIAGRLTERIVHLKAVRRLANVAGGGAMELDALGIVDTWCALNQRVGGGHETIVDWSGYTKNWKAKVYSGIRGCVKIDWLFWAKSGKGYIICVSDRGRNVLKLYDEKFAQVQQEFIDKYHLLQERKARKELIRELKRSNLAA